VRRRDCDAERALVRVGGLQAEGYGYVHSRFDGLAAERGWFVAPLANGIRSCRYEKRRPSHLVNVLDVSVSVNNHVQLDHTFDALALGVFGIDRFRHARAVGPFADWRLASIFAISSRAERGSKEKDWR